MHVFRFTLAFAFCLMATLVQTALTSVDRGCCSDPAHTSI